jgi:hypothetical protein
VKVELSAEAQAQVDRIDAWWRENRQAAPNLFAEELEAALGVRYAPRPSVRRLLLKHTHYQLSRVRSLTRSLVVRNRNPAAAVRAPGARQCRACPWHR